MVVIFGPTSPTSDIWRKKKSKMTFLLSQEYEFNPKSKLITVKEGTEEVVEIVATRVAYSATGVLTGLKGNCCYKSSLFCYRGTHWT